MAIISERHGFSPRNFGIVNNVHEITHKIKGFAIRQLQINRVRRLKAFCASMPPRHASMVKLTATGRNEKGIDAQTSTPTPS